MWSFFYAENILEADLLATSTNCNNFSLDMMFIIKSSSRDIETY